MNFIFYSISNDFMSFHRKREIEAIANDKTGEYIQVIYFNPPQFILKKLFFRSDKKSESSYSNIRICNLYILLPISLALKFRLLMYLLVTIPIKLQTLYVKKWHLNSGDCISWFYKPDQYLYLKSLKPYIYLHYDNYKGDKTYPYIRNKSFDTTLNECISNSLLTLVSSSRLFEQYKTISPDKVFYYPNAISRELIPNQEIDHVENKEKIIGFIGQLDQNFDSELLDKIADNFCDYKIKLIGPVKNEKVVNISNKHDNIELLGYMRYEMLSGEIKQFSIGICPYTDTDFNKYRNPLKIFEYFSYGIPVVSVKCDIDKLAKSLVGIASNHNEFIDLLETELDTNSIDKIEIRKKFAKNNCWNNRVSFILNELKKLKNVN